MESERMSCNETDFSEAYDDMQDNQMDVSERTTHDTIGELTAAAALTSLVTHGEQDYGDEGEYDDDDEEGKDFVIPQRFTRSGRKRAVSFPLKLMKVLATKEFNEIIAWMPSGKSFSIVNPKSFTAQILPIHFKSAKYSSFTRKLHRWGFMRHYRGDEAGAYYHTNFQKGRLDLVEKMTCYKQDPPKALSTLQGGAPAGTPQTQLQKLESNNLAVPPMHGLPPRAPVTAATPSPQRPYPTIAMSVTSLSPSIPVLSSATLRQSPLHQRHLVDPRCDLNTAIEMEVSRRIKERINAAVLSRTALLGLNPNPMMQVPLQHVPWHQRGHGTMVNQAPQVPMSLSGHNIGMKFERPVPQFHPVVGSSNMTALNVLPRTNIQGAKTA